MSRYTPEQIKAVGEAIGEYAWNEAQKAHAHRLTAAPEPAAFSVDLGYETIILRKMFGPTIFADLRIRADASTCEWIIERACGDVDCVTIWKEWARIPAQMEGDFDE